MAQISLDNIKKIEKNRNTIHEKVHAAYTVFEMDGEKYVQIDTYGRIDRENPEKISQSIQFDKVRTPLKKCSLTADDGASSPAEWCTHFGEMVHGGRGRGAPGHHAGNYSGMPLRLRMDSPSIWMV